MDNPPLDWMTPCGHGCIVGKPKGMATNGPCKHARLLRGRDLRGVMVLIRYLRDARDKAYEEGYRVASHYNPVPHD